MQEPYGMNGYNWISLAGLLVLVGLGWCLSAHRTRMNWRVILVGLGLQLTIGLFVFVVPEGTTVFAFVNDSVVKILDSATAGARFVFGPLALAPGQTDASGQESLGFMLAFQAFPTIIFFSSLVAILYYLGIMSVILRGFAWVFTKLMRVSGAESLVVSSNIFVGIESALTTRPYLANMTDSELCTILTAGMATVASNVLALYVFTLQQQFPSIAGHLVSASVLSAPAALVMSKVLLPETRTPETLGLHVKPYYERENNLFQAIINGANAGVKMIVGISALLIAVLGLVSLVDLILASVGTHVNPWFGWQGQWSLKALCGTLFYPLIRIIGISAQDAVVASRIIGERLIVTEVTAYQDLATALADRQLSMRSAVIVTYALCGFAHLASLAIFTGGICALAPGKTQDIGRVAVRALIAATLACLMTGCIAGVFYSDNSILFGGP